CTIRKDLVKGIQKLLKRTDLDYILIETTGIADPGPVAQTFLNVPQLQQYARLDSIITLVDGQNILQQLEETAVAKEQIALADFILLNKTDLVGQQELTALEESLTAINPFARIFRTEQSKVNLKELLDVEVFNLDHKLSVDPEFLNELKNGDHSDINSFSFKFDRPFEIEEFDTQLQSICEGGQVYRAKGIIWVSGNPRRAVFHGVNNRFTIYWDRLWEKEEPRFSQLVFIGKDLKQETFAQKLEECLAR
ncbi:MAG TPA: GTP-binding protein, partial [Chthoniobacterales bacterium]|nr:GTP-binding protein [Chthoniobacterales bacterium]